MLTTTSRKFNEISRPAQKIQWNNLPTCRGLLRLRQKRGCRKISNFLRGILLLRCQYLVTARTKTKREVKAGTKHILWVSTIHTGSCLMHYIYCWVTLRFAYISKVRLMNTNFDTYMNICKKKYFQSCKEKLRAFSGPNYS